MCGCIRRIQVLHTVFYPNWSLINASTILKVHWGWSIGAECPAFRINTSFGSVTSVVELDELIWYRFLPIIICDKNPNESREVLVYEVSLSGYSIFVLQSLTTSKMRKCQTLKFAQSKNLHKAKFCWTVNLLAKPIMSYFWGQVFLHFLVQKRFFWNILASELKRYINRGIFFSFKFNYEF